MRRRDARRGVVYRGEHPSLFDESHEARAQGRRARVSRLQLVEGARDVRSEARGVYVELAQGASDVRVCLLGELEQVVLYVYLVVRAREADRRRPFERVAARVVQATD